MNAVYNPAVAATGAVRPSGSLIARLVGWLTRRANENRAIARLEALTDRELADIGIERAEIERRVRGLRAR